MALDALIVAILPNHGITDFASFEDFDDAAILAIMRQVNRDPALPDFGQHSYMRFCTACEAVKYYTTVNRLPITTAMMRWSTVLKNFHKNLKTIKKLEDKTEPEIPRISRNLPVMDWVPAFELTLKGMFGTRAHISLQYVIRAVAVPPDAPPLEVNQVYSTEHGSVRAELNARALHDEEGYEEDNALVYEKLEIATRGTKYSASIQPFKRGLDGRGAYLAIVANHLGNDKWTIELDKHYAILSASVWKGTGNVTLETFIATHRKSYECMASAALHVDYQLPNELTRVRYLLTGILCADPKLQAAMSRAETDADINGNFEATAACIVSKDPVATRLARNKRGAGQISTVDASTQEADIAALNIKSGTGPKTGVHLRFFDPTEYHTLSYAEKDELRLWRKSDAGQAALAAAGVKKKAYQRGRKRTGRPSRSKSFKTNKANIASLVQAEVRTQLCTPPEEKPANASSISVEAALKIAKVAVAAAVKDHPLLAHIGAAHIGAATGDNASKKKPPAIEANQLRSILKNVGAATIERGQSAKKAVTLSLDDDFLQSILQKARSNNLI